MKIDYDVLKRWAKQGSPDWVKRPLETLFALSGANDPFVAGSPTRKKLGVWFATVWQQYGLHTASGVHLRRFHYRLMTFSSQTAILMPGPNGQDVRYENTEECWNRLLLASKYARALRLVNPMAFADHRNPYPSLVERFADAKAALDIANFDTWVPPEVQLLDRELGPLPALMLTDPTINQRYVIEVWCEKSSMDDILVPLCALYGVQYVTFVGEVSEIRCRELFERMLVHGRPTRILYISDFDPGGQSMPLAAARKIEHWLITEADKDPEVAEAELDIKLIPVALTKQQCLDFQLPRSPLKPGEKRADRFNERHADLGGAGGIELDALEALVGINGNPGLRAIVEPAILRSYDATLNDRVGKTVEVVNAELATLNTEAQDFPGLDEFRDRYRAQVDDVNFSLAMLRDKHAAAFSDFADEFNDFKVEVAAQLDATKPDLDDFDWPEPAAGNDPPVIDPDTGRVVVLYDSANSRDELGYLRQIKVYKRFQDKRTERKPGSGRKAKPKPAGPPPPKKKRGRPTGSKNKPKVPVPEPEPA
jgi:hypothetical protein